MNNPMGILTEQQQPALMIRFTIVRICYNTTVTFFCSVGAGSGSSVDCMQHLKQQPSSARSFEIRIQFAGSIRNVGKG